MTVAAPSLTLRDRAEAYASSAPGRKWPASRLQVVQEQGEDVLYGTWVIGAFFRNETGFYGAHPRTYLDRVMALFPDVGDDVLHACSGSLPPGPYVRLDLQHDLFRAPDVRGSVYDAPELLGGRQFPLVCIDPPYSDADALKYRTPMIDRRRAMEALFFVTAPGGHCVWLDVVWPMHHKSQWRTAARITLIRSTNHRVRMVTIFERRSE